VWEEHAHGDDTTSSRLAPAQWVSDDLIKAEMGTAPLVHVTVVQIPTIGRTADQDAELC
jgi:hypothetical protein